MKRCLKCASLMPDDAPKCIKCGLEAAPQPAPVRAATPPPVRPATPPPARVAAPVVKPAARSAKPGARPGKFRGAWALSVQSWRVLMLDRELLIFPLLSGVSCVLVLASFMAGSFVAGIDPFKEDGSTGPREWIVLFAYYFVNYFVIVFFNSALVACALIRFQGGDPTVRDGLRAAGERIVVIVAWAALAATVGVILRLIQERVEGINKLVVGLLGAVWTIAVYFVVPVLVVEKLGPFEALQRSVAIMTQTWGESLVSHVGLGTASFVASGVVVVGGCIVAGLLFTLTGSNAVFLTAMAATIVGLILVILVFSALESIVRSALYLYAAEDRIPEAFQGTLEHAFVPR